MPRTDMSESLAQITQTLKDYLNTRIDLLKLGLLQKLTKAGVFILTSVAVITTIMAACVFLMFAFSFWYGNTIGSLEHGFLISGGFFVILLLLVVIFRRAIFSRSLIKAFSQILFSDEDENK